MEEICMENEAKEFFLFFARFEYALKNSGYVSADRYGNAKPDWNKFKKDVSEVDNFIDKNDVDIRALREEPPRTQCYCSSELKWKDRPSISYNIVELIDACHTIRNNLFHGGKNNNRDLRRNLMLLRATRKILEATLEAKSDVKIKFDEAFLSIK